ncbi:herpeto-tandem family RiPP [Herpetosiphon llansteffanensis]|uniref:herpeto-tandem family RiPP n=1 Tax=Herpetosiphon llansteffanensis TaxID=2094568 RepID=UPI000D7BDD33|nr:herpeto-tandem family RiPP [Herpetosiphon llansteffanensis]
MEFETTQIEETPMIFGLTYLEEEAAEINDIVGCLAPINGYSGTGCDDSDVPPGTQIP